MKPRPSYSFPAELLSAQTLPHSESPWSPGRGTMKLQLLWFHCPFLAIHPGLLQVKSFSESSCCILSPQQLCIFLAAFFYPTTKPAVRRALLPSRPPAVQLPAVSVPHPSLHPTHKPSLPFPLRLRCSYKPRTTCWPTWDLGHSSTPRAQVTAFHPLAAPYQSQPTSRWRAVPTC